MLEKRIITENNKILPLINSNLSKDNYSEITATPTSHTRSSSYDDHCLHLIKQAALVFHEKPLGKLNVIGYATNMAQLFMRTNRENYIQRMARYGSAVEGFNELGEMDQKRMLASAFAEVVLVRSAFYFHPEKDSLIVRVVSDRGGERDL